MSENEGQREASEHADGLVRGLEEWFSAQSDGDWEHGYGVRIATLDNPGWKVVVDVTDTDLATASFDPVRIERTPTDWVHCEVKDGRFSAHGGVANLREMISMFLRWSRDAPTATR